MKLGALDVNDVKLGGLSVETIMLGEALVWAAGTEPPGGAPIPEAYATTRYNSNTTTHSVALPSGVSEGDVLLIFTRAGSNNPTSFTPPSGWDEIAERTDNGSSAVFARTADGLEGASVDIVFSSGRRGSHVAVRVSGGSGAVAAAVAASNVNDPPELTHGWGAENVLVFACVTQSQVDDDDIVGAPSGYSGFTRVRTVDFASTSALHCSTNVAHRAALAASENPGPFQVGEADINNPHSYTVAVRPA